MVPAPLSWPPSQWWEGDDGSWSTFYLRIGSPAQVVRVLPSTAGRQTWVVSPSGCPNDTSPSSSCQQARGGLFDPKRSSSWKSFGNYSLELEVNLGYNDTAPYGLDTVALGFNDTLGGPALKSQIITDVATNDFYLGAFGLGHQDTYLSNFTNRRPSFLTAMKEEGLIPSLSWAYTAGARYQLKGVYSSLTFGGYDRSRFIPNNVSMSMAPDISRDLVVGLHSVTSLNTNQSITQQATLLSTPVLAFVDSTLPYIYLPIEVCKKFESTLGLIWNETDRMYWIDDALHQSLSSSNITFTFTIGDTIAEGPTVQIVLPYKSFDLEVKDPFETQTMRYFPLQKGANESQYTLGRAFLQEAYVITDYERSNFSISQARFDDAIPTDLVPIEPKSSANTAVTPTPSVNLSAVPSASPSTSLSPGPPIGKTLNFPRHNITIEASIGTTTFLLLIVLAIVFAIRRRRIRGVETDICAHATPQQYERTSKDANAFAPMSAQEIATNSLVGLFRELPDSGKVELRDQRSFSESDNVTAGMATSDQLVAQELRTRRSSPSVLQSAATSESQNYLMKACARTRCNDKTFFDETSDAERVTAIRQGVLFLQAPTDNQDRKISLKSRNHISLHTDPKISAPEASSYAPLIDESRPQGLSSVFFEEFVENPS